MQPIRDKDFDQLFKDAFADAEVAPSRDLWSSIESEITPKKKRIIPIYWLSAAAVLLIATLGVLVYQQQDNTDGDKKLASNTIEKVKPAVRVQTTKDSSAAIVAPVENITPVLPVQPKAVSAIAKTKVKQNVKPAVEQQRIVTAPEMQRQETIVAKVEEPKKDIKTRIEEAILQPKEEVVTALVATPVKTDEPVNDNEQSNRGIRNVGDVVNLIVNKMDKRKDKLIQFRTDDDDSSLASINIGPFKIGKRNKK
ncbi:cytoskeletal protein RodZ [Flavobacterium sp. W4I14]|nr:cytoskeletal protein RodZ [Flavobacterium sp. W4I14]